MNIYKDTSTQMCAGHTRLNKWCSELVDREPNDKTLESSHGSILRSAFWTLPWHLVGVQVDGIHMTLYELGNW
jgi:hypothetical protein